MKDQLRLTEDEFLDFADYLFQAKGIAKDAKANAELIRYNIEHIKEYLAKKDVCLIKEIDEHRFIEKTSQFKKSLAVDDYDHMIAYHDHFDVKLMQSSDLKSVYVEMDVLKALFLEKPPKIPRIISPSIRLSLDDLLSMKFLEHRCMFTRTIQGRKALVERIVGSKPVSTQLFNMYAYNGPIDFKEIIAHCQKHPQPVFDDFYFFRDDHNSKGPHFPDLPPRSIKPNKY